MEVILSKYRETWSEDIELLVEQLIAIYNDYSKHHLIDDIVKQHILESEMDQLPHAFWSVP